MRSRKPYTSFAKPTGTQFIDLTGKQFGRLTVTGFAGMVDNTKYWSAECQCGTKKDVCASNMICGVTQSCGCLHRERTSQAKFKDITGRRYGRLIIVSFAEFRGSWSWWNAVCDCGNKALVKSGSLHTGHVRSCGCLASEHARALSKTNITHGMSYTTEYRTWRGMLIRCYDENAPKYYLYGGRGIIVCDRWRNSFVNFFSDMGYRPSNKHTIDRWPDKNGPYSPNNCRWATWSEQNSNRNTYTRRRSIKEWEAKHGHSED